MTDNEITIHTDAGQKLARHIKSATGNYAEADVAEVERQSLCRATDRLRVPLTYLEDAWAEKSDMHLEEAIKRLRAHFDQLDAETSLKKR